MLRFELRTFGPIEKPLTTEQCSSKKLRSKFYFILHHRPTHFKLLFTSSLFFHNFDFCRHKIRTIYLQENGTSRLFRRLISNPHLLLDTDSSVVPSAGRYWRNIESLVFVNYKKTWLYRISNWTVKCHVAFNTRLWGHFAALSRQVLCLRNVTVCYTNGKCLSLVALVSKVLHHY